MKHIRLHAGRKHKYHKDRQTILDIGKGSYFRKKNAGQNRNIETINAPLNI